MIKEAYVSFEVAKLLKEKGFNECTRKIYRPDGTSKTLKFWHVTNKYLVEHEYPKGSCTEPTQQMAIMWLAERKVRISIVWHIHSNEWYVEVTGSHNDDHGMGSFKIREEGIEKALKYSLLNLL